MSALWLQARVAFVLGVILMLLFQWWNRVPEPDPLSYGHAVQVPCSVTAGEGTTCWTTSYGHIRRFREGK